MSGRYDSVALSPDYLKRYGETGHAWREVNRLTPAFEDRFRDNVQRFHCAVEALVADNVIEHLATNQRGVREQLFNKRAKLPGPAGAHKAFDILHIDIGSEPDRRNQGERFHPIRMRRGQLECSSSPKRMTHQVSPFNFECGQRSEEHTSELQSLAYLVCRLLLEKK